MLGGLLDKFWVDLAREVARGAIEGLLQRYSVEDVRWHIEHDTNLIESVFTIGTETDRRQLARLSKLASKHRDKLGKAREAVTVDWVISRMHKYFPDHARLLDGYEGRRWVQKNIDAGFRYFLGS